MFELVADQRQEFDQLASTGALGYTVLERPQRDYLPPDGRASEIIDDDAEPADSSAEPPTAKDQLDMTMARSLLRLAGAVRSRPTRGRLGAPVRAAAEIGGLRRLSGVFSAWLTTLM